MAELPNFTVFPQILSPRFKGQVFETLPAEQKAIRESAIGGITHKLFN